MSSECGDTDLVEDARVERAPKQEAYIDYGAAPNYPIEYDYTLLYLPEDENEALAFHDTLQGYGLQGCLYNDKSVVPVSLNAMECHEYTCQCSTVYLVYVTPTLCKAMQLFSRKANEVFKSAKYGALYKCLRDKQYKHHFVPYYPRRKNDLEDIPFALAPLAGLEGKSPYYYKHLCHLFGLVSVDDYKSFKPDPNHQAQRKKEARRRQHAADEIEMASRSQGSSLEDGMKDLIVVVPKQSQPSPSPSSENLVIHSERTIEAKEGKVIIPHSNSGQDKVAPTGQRLMPEGEDAVYERSKQQFFGADGQEVPNEAAAATGGAGLDKGANTESSSPLASVTPALDALTSDPSKSPNRTSTELHLHSHHYYFSDGSNPVVQVGDQGTTNVYHQQPNNNDDDDLDEDGNVEYTRAPKP